MVGRGRMIGAVLGLVMAGAVPSFAVEDAGQALPTLLIKGEIVSTDTNDPTATLIKVKDRYGFETPIYLAGDARLTSGTGPITVAALIPGVPVEVEYNFDINTAKRHAVSVKLSGTEAAAAAEPVAAPVAAEPAPVPVPDAPAFTPELGAPMGEPVLAPPIDSPVMDQEMPVEEDHVHTGDSGE